MRAWDDVHRGKFTNALRCCGTGIGGGFDRAHITAHHHSDISAAHIFRTDQHHIRGFHHRIRSFDRANQPTRLNHSQSNHYMINRHFNFPFDYDLRKTTSPSTSSESITDIMTESTGVSFVILVCRADEPAAVRPRSPTPASTGSTWTYGLPAGTPCSSR